MGREGRELQGAQPEHRQGDYGPLGNCGDGDRVLVG